MSDSVSQLAIATALLVADLAEQTAVLLGERRNLQPDAVAQMRDTANTLRQRARAIRQQAEQVQAPERQNPE